MNAPQKLPPGAQPDPDHPGWYSWGDFPRGSFAGQTGRLLFRPDGEGARVRMFPTEKHLNMGGSIHGGAVMSVIDMALFAGGRRIAGMARAITSRSTARPISSRAADRRDRSTRLVRIVGETKGGLVFLSGHCEQDGQPTHSFTGTLKRIRPKESRSDA